MDLGIISSVMSGVKYLPEYLSGLIILVALVLSFIFKSRGQDHQQVTEVSRLQTEQLKVLIEQNDKLIKSNSTMNQQIEALRTELSEAYTVIDNLRFEVHSLHRQMTKGGI